MCRHQLHQLLPLLALTFALGAVPARPCQAQWRVDGAPVCTAGSFQDYPTIAPDGAGGAIITWMDLRQQNNGYYLTYVQRLNSAGAPQWTADGVLLSNTPALYPTIVADGSGGAIITWGDGRNGNADIYAQRVNAAGVPQWADSGVALCTALNNQLFPRIAPDGAGGAIVSWIDGRSGSSYDIYAQRVNAAGVPQWADSGVALGASAYPQSQDLPAIVPDGAGGGIVTWTGSTVSGDHVYAQHVSADGVPQWTAGGVRLCATEYNQVNPTIAADGAGGAIVAWSDIRNGAGNFDIFARRVSAAGSPQWPAEGVALCAAMNDQTHPTIVADGAGGAIVTWQDARNGVGNFDIYAQRLSAAGVPQWADSGVALCIATNEQSAPMIASDGAGGAIVTWRDARAGSFDVYAQRVNAAGAPQWAENGAALCTAAYNQDSPMIVPDGAGGAIVTWYDQRDVYPYTDIYAQKVYGSGVAAVPSPSAPAQFLLLEPSPNPSRDGQFRIGFDLPRSERVSAEVFDLEGERVRTLATNREFPAGPQALGWDGRNDAGVGLPSGVYFVEVRAGTHAEARRAVLLH
ncbi:MAG TPA: FlgD immunoglobulin-like domain containing protein [Candidatus Eisenbacteria bacterium]|nr:FlgD immunoglobulin-like domain containing protein [Candidatus Eisenbacteria bacterium]